MSKFYFIYWESNLRVDLNFLNILNEEQTLRTSWRKDPFVQSWC